MLEFALLGAFASTASVSSNANAPTTPICWVTDVVVSKNGVRIYFPRGNSPSYILSRDNIVRPSDAPIDTARPKEVAVEAKLGDHLTAGNSHHDNCAMVVAMRNGRIGVEAKAFLNLPGLPPDSKSEFMPAHD